MVLLYVRSVYPEPSGCFGGPVNGVVEWNCVMLFLHQATLHIAGPVTLVSVYAPTMSATSDINTER